MMPPRTPPTPPALDRQRTLVLWSSFFALLLVSTVLSALVVPARTRPELAGLMLLVIAVLSAGELLAGSIILRSLRRKASSGPPEAAAAVAGTQLLVACAIAFGVGIFGAVLRFVTGSPLFLIFAAGSAAVLLRWFPSESRWAQLSQRGGAGPRNPMMRG